ncbi:MAG: DNA gyrase subunit A [Firmicutes bacterium]|nr:DNA gyrase subunit A [Bacillota bacterium]
MDDFNGNITDRIQNRNLEKEMQESFLMYAMSVIVARALPDVRDGLKPVHRRILYAMDELSLAPNKAYKKSARIVGDTMGKYHPHGDMAIYDAMVRMAQDFSIRYPLVDGHGNFGSMDGDGAAASRYTEARLSPLAMEMLTDIDKDTVDFIPNYDGEFQEPTVLPSRFPNLLVNGSSGIAVGMATNIPPHNLNECIDAVVKIIDNHVNEGRETEIHELLNIVKGPDFPTGASILGLSGVRQAYRTGRGKVIVRASAVIEPMPGAAGRERILVSELPYQVNKAKLIEKMAELVKDKKVEGITDIRDESNRDGVKVVIELRKDANANVVLNKLYSLSSLQESFGVIMLALVGSEAKILNLKEMLVHYLNHQKDVVTRRTRFDLNKSLKRAHILEGLLIALDNIDEVIAIIRSSEDGTTARARLQERFSLSEEQAGAIVDMRLRSLTGLERAKLEQEYAELEALIKELELILSDENRLYSVIREEILVLKAKYGDERRTKILIDADEGEIDLEDMIDEESSVITMTHLDYIKRIPTATYKSQNRGGKGVMGMQVRDEDLVKSLFVASTHDYVLFFTNQGRVYRTKAYEIPPAGRTARGMAIVNLLNLNGGEKVAAVIPVREFDPGQYLVMVTKNGAVKKTSLDLFENIRKGGLIALNIREDDELIAVLRTDGEKNIFIATRNGMGIRFGEAGVRPVGRTAAGVRGIDMAEGDRVVGAGVFPDGGGEEARVLFVSENGYGKCTDAGVFRAQRRNGKGLRVYRITEKTGPLAGVCMVNDREGLMIINSEGVIIRLRIADISVLGRVTQGVKLINLGEGVTVVDVAKIAEDDCENGTENRVEAAAETNGSAEETEDDIGDVSDDTEDDDIEDIGNEENDMTD